MLNNKDYCDLDTSHELWVMGLEPEAYYDGPLILLYEAQKWLREEKNIIVDVRYGSQYYNVALHHRITCRHYVVKDKNNRIADFTEYEEALSEGIKEAVKILKENESI